MEQKRRHWLREPTTWAAITGCLGVIGTAWAFAIEASPAAKAAFATVTGIAAVLEGFFLAGRIKRRRRRKERADGARDARSRDR